MSKFFLNELKPNCYVYFPILRKISKMLLSITDNLACTILGRFLCSLLFYLSPSSRHIYNKTISNQHVYKGEDSTQHYRPLVNI